LRRCGDLELRQHLQSWEAAYVSDPEGYPNQVKRENCGIPGAAFME
jgi:hypothetical protein